jgi:four helix bundle protein
MRLNRFEEIEAWKAARMLVNCVYDAIRENADFRKDFRLVNQIQGAAVSSMSNIAEGFSRQSSKEFIQFLFIAKSSAAEVQSQLYVALRPGSILTQERFDERLSTCRKRIKTYLRLHKIPENNTGPNINLQKLR